MLALAGLAGLTHAQTVINLPPNTVSAGTVLPNGATVNVSAGGIIPLSVDLTGGTLNVAGGQVAVGATGISTGFTNSNNRVNVTGGQIGGFFQLTNGTTLNLSAGQMESFGVFSGSTATITGGLVTRFPDTFSSGTVNLSGGDVLSIRAFGGSTINISGTAFSFNGSPIAGLSEAPTLFTSRGGGVLRVTLLDGNEFVWTLRTGDPGFFAADPGFASTAAAVNLILVTPVLPCPADVNGDGALTGSDFSSWVQAFNTADPACDQNQDDLCTAADFSAWVQNFNSGCP
jgi:hypothetical protein